MAKEDGKGKGDQLAQVVGAMIGGGRGVLNDYRAGVRARATLDLMAGALKGVAPIAYAPLLELARLKAEQFYEIELSSPSAAVVPAHQVLNALESIRHKCAPIATWGITPPPNWLVRLLRRPIYWGGWVAREGEYLSGIYLLLREVENQVTLAFRASLLVNSPLRALAGQPEVALPKATPLVEIPSVPVTYTSIKDQAIDVRLRIGMLAGYLVEFANRGIEDVMKDEFNHGIAYNPITVRSEAALLLERVIVARAACEAIAALANQPLASRQRGKRSDGKSTKKSDATPPTNVRSFEPRVS